MNEIEEIKKRFQNNKIKITKYNNTIDESVQMFT